jgi:hypothetical protein
VAALSLLSAARGYGAAPDARGPRPAARRLARGTFGHCGFYRLAPAPAAARLFRRCLGARRQPHESFLNPHSHPIPLAASCRTRTRALSLGTYVHHRHPKQPFNFRETQWHS